MKRSGLSLSILLIVMLAVSCSGSGGGDDDDDDDNNNDDNDAAAFTLTSTDITSGGTIPAAHALDIDSDCPGSSGNNTSPQLAWTDAPANTASFAITMRDLTVPTVHWIVYNIPLATTSLNQGGSTNLPAGAAHGNTDMGIDGYAGPCPPTGQTNTYELRVWALDVDDLADDATIGGNLGGATADEIIEAIDRHDLDQASFTGTYTGE